MQARPITQAMQKRTRPFIANNITRDLKTGRFDMESAVRYGNEHSPISHNLEIANRNCDSHLLDRYVRKAPFRNDESLFSPEEDDFVNTTEILHQDELADDSQA